MKCVSLPDSLLEEARKAASQELTTVKTLIEEGFCQDIDNRKRKRAFRLRKATFKGNGLQPDAAGASWEKIREISYEGRGG